MTEIPRTEEAASALEKVRKVLKKIILWGVFPILFPSHWGYLKLEFEHHAVTTAIIIMTIIFRAITKLLVASWSRATTH